MISDPTDPVVRATLALDEAQRAYDAALTKGAGLSYEARHCLAARLAVARQKFRIEICGYDDRIDETAVLTHLLPALSPCVDEE